MTFATNRHGEQSIVSHTTPSTPQAADSDCSTLYKLASKAIFDFVGSITPESQVTIEDVVATCFQLKACQQYLASQKLGLAGNTYSTASLAIVIQAALRSYINYTVTVETVKQQVLNK